MKRFFGWILAGLGAAAVLWSGYHIVQGRSQVQWFGVNAMTAGLAGLASLTLGLIWTRD